MRKARIAGICTTAKGSLPEPVVVNSNVALQSCNALGADGRKPCDSAPEGGVAQVVQAVEDGGAEDGDLVGGPDEVGHHHRLHAGGMGGAHAGMRILDREAGAGFDPEQVRGPQIGLGMRLGIGHVVAGDDGGEALEQAGAAEMAEGMGRARGGGDRRRDARARSSASISWTPALTGTASPCGGASSRGTAGRTAYRGS